MTIRERITQSFARQGLMATLGAELQDVAPGRVSIRLPARPAIDQQHDFVHGGAVAAVLDSACGYAALTEAPEGFEVLTVEYKINLLRPASGRTVLATGSVIRAGRTLTTAQGYARMDHADAEPIALMQATMMLVPLAEG